jgi:hypothetical protein
MGRGKLVLEPKKVPKLEPKKDPRLEPNKVPEQVPKQADRLAPIQAATSFAAAPSKQWLSPKELQLDCTNTPNSSSPSSHPNCHP